MAFDPHRDTSVVSGAFSVDVNQLCSVYTLLTYEETLSIGPAKAALNTALWEADLGATLFPDATAGLIDAINTALEALGTLESTVNSLLWKLQDAALTYGDAESMASLWEAVPGSPMGPQLTAGGIATPADAAMMMQLGAEGVFVGSGIFKSGDPAKRAAAIVKATTFYDDPSVIAEVSRGLGEAMVGINVDDLPVDHRLAERGW